MKNRLLKSGFLNNRFLWAAAAGTAAAGIVYFLTENMLVAAAVWAAAAAAYAFFFRTEKPRDPLITAADDERSADLVLSESESVLAAAMDSASAIENKAVQKKALELCASMQKILDELRINQKKIPSARKFLNYYLPTLNSILEKFERIEENDAADSETQNKTAEYLGFIDSAAKKMHTKMFEDDLLDMAIEMEIMAQAVKDDGLIENENNITLPSN